MDKQLGERLGRIAARTDGLASHRFKAFAIAADGAYTEIEAAGVFVETSAGRGVFVLLAGTRGPHDVELLAAPLQTAEAKDSADFVTKHGCSNACVLATVLASEGPAGSS